jgi:tetratricopeptide (TPR) repeat protein
MSTEPEKPAPIPRDTRFALACCGIWVFAFALRAVYLLQIKLSPMFSALVVDALGYDRWAREIAGGDWLGTGVFYQAPLYPYFLGLIYTVAGPDLVVVRWVQIALGSTACVLLAVAGRSFFGAAAGIVAGMLLALCPVAIFFDGLIQKSVLDVFFVCLLLLVLGSIHRRPKTLLWLLAGIVSGALALVRENALIFAPIIAFWIFAQFRALPLRNRLQWAGVFVIGLGIILLPVAVRNKRVGGEFHLTTAQFGPNFYIGNNEQATGTYEPLRFGRGSPEFERTDATELAEQALGRQLAPAEVSRYWAGKAIDYIVARPAEWLRLSARKWLLVFNATELADAEDPYTYADYSPLLSALLPVFHFGVLVPLAVFGVVLTWNDLRKTWLVLALLLGYAASVALFYVLSRYRYPLTPMLVIYAAAGLIAGWQLLRARSFAPMARAAIIAGLVAVAANWPLAPKESVRAWTEYNVGVYLQSQQQDNEKARPHFEKALLLNPNFAEAHNNLGVILTEEGKIDEALDHYTEAVRHRPDYADAQFNLAVILSAKGRLDEAVPHFKNAIELMPGDAEAHTRLGNVLVRLGRTAEAIEHFREALRIDPGNAEAQTNLERISSQGDSIR